MSDDVAHIDAPSCADSTRPIPAGEHTAAIRPALNAFEPLLPDVRRRLPALDDPTRIRIPAELDAAPASPVTTSPVKTSPVKTIASAFGRAPNTVIQAFATLDRLGVVTGSPNGWLSGLTITDDAVHGLLAQLAAPATTERAGGHLTPNKPADKASAWSSRGES